jgi:hypothetical protein
MPTSIPNYEGRRRARNAVGDYGLSMTVADRPNVEYYREKAKYIAVTKLFRPVRLLVTNAGGATAQNVRVEIAVDRQEDVGVLPESEMPDKPGKSWDAALMQKTRPVWRELIDRHDGRVCVETHADKFKVTVDCGTLQPKRALASDRLFAGRLESGAMEMKALIYADNLSTPKAVDLLAHFTVAHRQVSVHELTAED